MIVSQNHYLNKILDVHPLRGWKLVDFLPSEKVDRQGQAGQVRRPGPGLIGFKASYILRQSRNSVWFKSSMAMEWGLFYFLLGVCTSAYFLRLLIKKHMYPIQGEPTTLLLPLTVLQQLAMKRFRRDLSMNMIFSCTEQL